MENRFTWKIRNHFFFHSLVEEQVYRSPRFEVNDEPHLLGITSERHHNSTSSFHLFYEPWILPLMSVAIAFACLEIFVCLQYILFPNYVSFPQRSDWVRWSALERGWSAQGNIGCRLGWAKESQQRLGNWAQIDGPSEESESRCHCA